MVSKREKNWISYIYIFFTVLSNKQENYMKWDPGGVWSPWHFSNKRKQKTNKTKTKTKQKTTMRIPSFFGKIGLKNLHMVCQQYDVCASDAAVFHNYRYEYI